MAAHGRRVRRGQGSGSEGIVIWYPSDTVREKSAGVVVSSVVPYLLLDVCRDGAGLVRL